MEVVIFKELTTSKHLKQLKDESEEYTGLYVDMEDKKQRKYVKDKAADIKTLIAKVERRRIDTVAEYKIDVEKEAASITEDLVIANLPFTLLIDDYAAARKVVLDKEKADKLAIELAVKFESDHEFALLMNNQFDADKVKIEQERIAYDLAVTLEAEEAAEAKAKLLAQEQIDNAKIAEQKAIEDKIKADAELVAANAREELLNEQAAQNKIKAEWLSYISEAYQINDDLNYKAEQKRQSDLAEENRLKAIETERLAGIERQRIAQKKLDDEEAVRMADANNIRLINRAIFTALTNVGLDSESAKLATKALIDSKIPHTQINY